jgi:hypothetical protein
MLKFSDIISGWMFISNYRHSYRNIKYRSPSMLPQGSCTVRTPDFCDWVFCNFSQSLHVSSWIIPRNRSRYLPSTFFLIYLSLILLIFDAICYWWPPLLSSGRSSWLQIQRSGFDSRRYQIFFWEVVGLERGPLSLVMIIEEIFQGNSGSGLETRKLTTVGESLRWPHYTLYPLKLVLTSPTSGGRSVGRYSSHADSSHGVEFFRETFFTS